MKYLPCLLALLTLLATTAHGGDTGTLDMSWDEFQQLNLTCGNTRIFGIRHSVEVEKEYQKHRIGFNAQNNSPVRVRLFYSVCVFDAAGNLLFAASEDHSLNKNEMDDTDARAPVPLGMEFSPARVKFRVIW